MPEKKTEVKTFHVVYICDACGEGELQARDGYSNNLGTRWRHLCNKCNAVKDFDYNVKYPHTVYETITKLESF